MPSKKSKREDIGEEQRGGWRLKKIGEEQRGGWRLVRAEERIEELERQNRNLEQEVDKLQNSVQKLKSSLTKVKVDANEMYTRGRREYEKLQSTFNSVCDPANLARICRDELESMTKSADFLKKQNTCNFPEMANYTHTKLSFWKKWVEIAKPLCNF